MNIDIKDLITLDDDNQYAVCSKATYQEKEYLYLIDINDNQNFKFARIEIKDSEVKIIETLDEQLIQNLLPLFFDNVKDILNDIEQ